MKRFNKTIAILKPISGAAAVVALTVGPGLATRVGAQQAKITIPSTVIAQAQGQEQEQQQQKFGETVVTADNIDYDLGKKQVIATGNVDLVSGNSHLTAEKMTVQMASNKGLDWAQCEGKVMVEKKNPDTGVTITARSSTLNYSETDQKANLEGNVVTFITSPKLAKPAVITGAKVDMDLKTEVNVIHRGPDAQAKVHVEPKGQEGQPAPEPIDLIADRIDMKSATQEYVATGKPALVRPTSKLQAKKIRFQVEDDKKDVKVAYAEQDVIFDGQGEKGAIIHATADNGTFEREINQITLTGMVLATTKDVDAEKPTVYQGGRFLYNTKTRSSKLQGTKEVPAKIIVPDGSYKPQTVAKPEGGEKPAAPGNDKK